MHSLSTDDNLSILLYLQSIGFSINEIDKDTDIQFDQ